MQQVGVKMINVSVDFLPGFGEGYPEFREHIQMAATDNGHLGLASP